MHIAAIVMVMISSGMFIKPIKPRTEEEAMMLGITAMKANFMDRNKNKNIIMIAAKTNPIVRICEVIRLSSTLLYKTSIPVSFT